MQVSNIKRFVRKVALFSILMVASLLLLGFLLPYDGSFESEQIVKDELLRNNDDNPKVVLTGGSSVAFGYNSDSLSSWLGKPVYNNGLHGGFGMKFIIDNCSQYLNEGDVLVVIPEYGCFGGGVANGGIALTNLVLMDPLRYGRLLNVRQWNSVLNSYPPSLFWKLAAFASSLSNNEKHGPYSRKSFNSLGDNIANKGTMKLNMEETSILSGGVNQEFVDYFFAKLSELESKGVKIVCYPPAITHKVYAESKIQCEKIYDLFESKGHPFVRPLQNSVYPDSLFFDTHYHLNDKGALNNTKELYYAILKSGVLE